MFLKRIQSLALEWNVSIQDLREFSLESLRYGTRLEREPKKLKKILRQLKQDDLLAVKLWAGSYYLLIRLPMALKGIEVEKVAPEDLEYAERILTPEELTSLKQRNIKPLELMESIAKIKSVYSVASFHGRFLSTLDPMRENKKKSNDILQDLLVDTLVVANRTMAQWNLSNEEDFIPFLACSIRNKANTMLSRSSPKLQRLNFQEVEKLQKVLETKQPDAVEDAPVDFSDEENYIQEDLKSLLGPLCYRGVLLIMGKAPEQETQAFENFLTEQGIDRTTLSAQRLKQEIERYLGYRVFQKMKQNETLRDYLKAA